MKNFKLFEKCNRRIARRVTLIAVLLAMCIPQAWAGTGSTFNKPYFFYYNDDSWSKCMVLYGREWNTEYDGYTPGHYTKSWNLALVGNTEKLYYAYIDDYWNDSYNQIAVVEAENWSTERNKIGDRWGSVKHTDYIIQNYSIDYWHTYFWNGKGASSLTHCEHGAADITKYTTTLNIKKKTSSGGSYSNASTSDGLATGLKITGSWINDDHRTEAVRDDAAWSEGYSCSYNSVVSGLVTVSYTSLGSNWQFDGWYINDTRTSTESSYSFYQHANTTVEARFSRKFTVTYNANGGSVTPSSAQPATAFSSVTLPTPTLSGCTFEGWYNSEGTKIGNAGASYTPTADITLYAHYTDNISGKLFSYIDGHYGAKYQAFDGTKWVSSNQSEKDKTFTNASTGVQFVVDNGGWDQKSGIVSLFAKCFGSNKGNTSMSIVIPTGKKAIVKILYGAYDTGKKLTIGGTAQDAPAAKMTDGMTTTTGICTEVTKTNQRGTLTLGTSGENDNIYIARVSAVITGYTITYNPGAYGSGSIDAGTKTHGTNFTLSSSTFSRDGYTQDGWSINANGSTKDYNLGGTYSSDAAITLYPHWVATNYTLSYDLAGGSVESANPTSYTILSSAITLNNPTKNGYIFAGWTGTDLAEATTTVTIAVGSTGDRSYTATWTCKTPVFGTDLSTTPVEYTVGASAAALTVAASANSGTIAYQWYSNDENNYTSPNTLTGQTGASYTPSTAAAGTTYYFCTATNTTGGCSATTNSQIANIAVSLSTYTITHRAASNGSYTIKVGDSEAVSTNTTAAASNTITLAATPSSGYQFAGWKVFKDASGDAVSVSENAFTMPAEAVTVVAFFTYASDLVTLEPNTLYKAENMVASSITSITGSEQYAAGVSSDRRFEMLGAGTTNENTGKTSTIGIKDNNSDAADATIDGKDFAYSLFFKGASHVVSNIPLSRAVKFRVPASGKLVVYTKNGKKINYAKSGAAGTAINESGENAKNEIDVTAGVYYIYATDKSTTLFGLQFVPACTDPGLAFAADSKTTTLCDAAPTNALTNTHSVAVTYTSSDETVATVAADGTLTIKAAGTTTITASSIAQTVSAVDYCADEASYTLTVSASTAAGLAYGTSTMEKNVGDANLTNPLTNSNSLEVTYTSSDEDVATVDATGEVTIKAAGTATITAHSALQKKSSTCYAEGEASYTLTVYPIYTVTYKAMGGTCGTASAVTELGKVTLPSATHGTYTTYTWVTYDGAFVGYEGEEYEPSGDITLYAKWQGDCAAGGGSDGVLFSAEFKDSGLGTENVCTAANDPVTFTTDQLKDEPKGGSISAYTTETLTHVKYVDNGVYLKGTDGVIKITLEAAINTNDLFEYVNVHSSNPYAYLRHTSASNSTDQIVLTGYNSKNVKVMLPAAFNGKKELYIVKQSTDFKLHKAAVVRPAFLMLLRDDTPTDNTNLSGTDEALTTENYLEVIRGGSASYTSPTSGDLIIKRSDNKNYVQFNKSAGYLKITVSQALQEGDVIGFDSYNTGELALTTTAEYSNTIHTTSQLYTVGSSSPLKDQTTFYIWQYSGSANYLRGLQIARSAVVGSSCYQVTYNGNGADGGYTNDPAQYAASGTVTVLANGFTKTGYAFAGWNTKADGSGATKQPGATFAITQDTTLHAQWKQIKYFTTEGNWSTSGNWSPSGVPAIKDPVVIQANVTVDINNAKALRVDIKTGNTLTINAGMALIIAETLTKNGGATEAADVIINSTRDIGTGALIIGSEAGDNAATMNFETKAKLVGGSTVNQFIGSPFSNAAPYVDYGQQLYKFCPKQNGDRGWWQSHTSLATMTPFWGYNVLCTETSFLNLNWTGKLNPSESKTITDFYYNGSSETDNMFANSWTAPIHVGAFEDGDFVNASTTLYMFNAGTPAQEARHSGADATNSNDDPGTYISIPIHSATYAGIGVIPSMQAFYVLSTGSGASITLDYNKIVYTPALTSVGIVANRAPRHSAEVVEPEVIKLRVQSETGWGANTYVLGRADFAEGYEDGWDGAYIEGESATPKLYTPSIDGNMFINCLPEIEGTVVGFRKGSSDNNYIFSFDYNGDEVWYLNDQKAQKSTQIMNGQTYAFESEAGDNAARFVISATPINKIATGCESVGAEAAKVRKLIINDKVYIIRGGQVFDVLGKTIKK